MSIPVRRGRLLAATVLAALVVAFALRVLPAGVPPGLYDDEAYYGLDAASVLAGHPALFFPANNGREPLFIHLVAGLIAILGRTPAALRLASALVGTATVAAAWVALAPLAGRRAALVAVWLCAVAPWPVLLGRAGFRAGTLPLLLALAVAAGARALRRGEARWAVGAGALAGLTLYTYTAARLVPLLAVLAGAWLWWRGPRPGRPLVVRWLAAALVVAAPLALWLAGHPDLAVGRLAEVALTSPAVGGGQTLATLWASLVATAGMLTERGDFIPRHNIPLRPVFGLLAGVLALVGLGAAVARARWRPALGVLLAWLLVMALPTILAENAPHFLRAVGLLPAVLALPGLGAVALASLVGRWRRSWSAPLWVVLAVAVVGGELWATVTYLRTAAVGEGTALYYAFEAGAADLARAINLDRGAGWRGGWAEGVAGAGQPVWLDRRLRDGWAAVPYLVPEGTVTLVDPYDPILTTVPGVAYLQPVGLDLDRLWSGLAPRAQLSFELGATERADLAPDATRLYARVQGAPAAAVTAPIAQFANGVRLLSADVQPTAAGDLDVETVWDTVEPVPGRDVTAFFQVLEGDRLVVTDDAPLGSGLFPTPRWRVGDQVVERRRLVVPGGFDRNRHRLVTGLYVAPDTTPIAVVGPSDRAPADRVELVPGVGR